MNNDIQRFIDAQKKDYEIALSEIKQGHKENHWMWYIFPQILGLGESPMAEYYEIKGINEGIDYLKNEYLYNNFINICEELLKLKTDDPQEIFGTIDAMKLKSSMTLFDYICELDKNGIDTFQKVLGKYYKGEKDIKTININTGKIYNHRKIKNVINDDLEI